MATEMVDVDFIITALEELNNTSFKVYPNPAKEQITIEFREVKSGKLIIRDISGREVLVQKFTQTPTVSISVQELSQGVYFLSFNNKVIKFVKE